MEYRRLGRSGVRVSVIGLGTNRFGTEKVPPDKVKAILDEAEDLGINFIDTANTYVGGQSEIAIGRALQGRRDRFVIATKFYLPVGEGPNDRGASRYHMYQALEGSLLRLETDHVDLYYVHRWDPETPLEETLRGLDDLVRMGKVRYAGCSSYASWQLAHANLLADVRGWSSFAVIQSEYHMLARHVEQEVLPYCRHHGVGFVPYYPLAGGFLTGKYKRGKPPPPGSRGETSRQVQRFFSDPNYRKVEKLQEWAQARGRGVNELAQAWLLAQKPVCSVITGVTEVEYLHGNVRAANWNLSPEELQEIKAVLASA